MLPPPVPAIWIESILNFEFSKKKKKSERIIADLENKLAATSDELLQAKEQNVQLTDELQAKGKSDCELLPLLLPLL